MFAARLRALGDTRQWQYDAPQSRLTLPPVDGRIPSDIINLPNMYREYISAKRGMRADTLQHQATGMMQHYIPETLAEARSHLRPVIRSATERGYMYLSLGETAKRDIVFRPLCENLEIGIAYDSEYTIARLTGSTLAKWGVSFEEAYEIAIDNLRAESTRSFTQLQNGVLMSAYDDHYDAGRLLLTDLLHRQGISGAPVVMAPNRKVLLLTGEHNDAGLATMVSIAESALQEPRPLPPLMLRWNGERWEKFAPQALAQKLALMRIKEVASDYEAQKTRLDQLFQQRKTDIFVAKFTALQAPDGSVHSLCAWTEGVRSLLPAADKIFLFRPSTNQHVQMPWEEVVAACGHLLKPTDHLPIRYEVDAFPEQAIFETWVAKAEPPVEKPA
ncbi:hypothetical protein GCM10011400_47970 [Paraburkholderia caffeinilytica]|uniref:Uncharacterized protein n=1 Tax=Paraburkholderia caffeinilytica TaxID=1761016 RepID=A0ABQ1NCN8_9BURK|nr:hypothetical protein GCM10011400_47970 [Paraburkholderia caffeinilytica]